MKFQRTRGVLRLMAADPLLVGKRRQEPPDTTLDNSIDDGRVQSELTRYLSDNWMPIIEKDVDGSGSLPLKIDNEYQTSASCTRHDEWRARSISAQPQRLLRPIAAWRTGG